MPEVGFILLTHRNPPQAARLVRTLNRLFNYPPIVCHHDFSKCDFAPELVSENVTFVRPSFVTGWAKFSVVDATIRALEIIFSTSSPPQWAVVLSGADYPIKNAEIILEDLNRGGYDAHLKSWLVDRRGRKTDPVVKEYFRRYRCSFFSVHSLDRRFRYRKREFWLRIPFYTSAKQPFSKKFQCYAGFQWCSVNARAAEKISVFHKNRTELADFYQTVQFPDESYFQTILSNDLSVRVNSNDWRYAEFTPGKPNPKVLGMADLPALLATPDHFARKFEPEVDDEVLGVLDQRIGVR